MENGQHHFSLPATARNSGASTPQNRSYSPEDYVDDITPAANPFATPYGSHTLSARTSSAALHQQALSQRYFHSRRVKKGEVEKPWTTQKDPREKWVTIIPLIGLFIGLAISGFLIYDGLRTVVNHEYCPVLDENFSGGLDSNTWLKEAEVGGFGNGQFEQTTSTDENIFIQDGQLVIKPTLQDAALIESDNIIDLTADGTCSSDIVTNCLAATNTTNGTIVNPVKSGRLSTRNSHSIKYGRIEVTAQLPSGDWLWPAIWMLPTESVYGVWPQSGEIDIAEGRGNNHTYAQGGANIVSSALHWGPNSANDAWWRTNVKRKALHTTYAAKFHTFGMEWSEKYLFTYIDTRLLQVLYANFDQPLWQRGNFPLADKNGTRLVDPWSQTGNDATPFDQNFYLILNVAVGGTNGWFEDGKSGKPWVDGSPTARRDFWNAQDSWFPTWKEGGTMKVKSVKMWQQKGYNGC
jgi:beta-glucanase (GH16 family)